MEAGKAVRYNASKVKNAAGVGPERANVGHWSPPMYEIPLFPLNTVLFPGVPIFLNIFEPRYKAMLRYCLENDKPFGVVLIKEGVDAFGPAVPHMIGCSARIAEAQSQENGNIHIVAVGVDRFRVLALQHDNPYLVGQVVGYPLQPPNDAEAGLAAKAQLLPFLERYVELLSRIGNADFDQSQLPEDTSALLYVAAYLLQVPMEEKQRLLQLDTQRSMFDELRTLYRRETAFLRLMAERKEASQDDAEPDSLFSLN